MQEKKKKLCNAYSFLLAVSIPTVTNTTKALIIAMKIKTGFSFTESAKHFINEIQIYIQI